MSIVTVQVGQCGNQIGGQFFSTVINDINTHKESKAGAAAEVGSATKKQSHEYNDLSTERFFSQDDVGRGGEMRKIKARAVMVDMEPKVIGQTVAEAKRSGVWMYPDKQQFCQKRGSGNNWAHGYCIHGPQCREAVLNMVRREVEKCDRFGGFLALLSLAGGTGSGVGTYITQCLRDEYPDSFIVNQVVWPYSTGEVIVQNYNAVLTLSHLYQCSDAILALENDSLDRICSQLLNIKKVSFGDINRVVAHQMASVFQPCFTEVSSMLVRNQFADTLEHLVPHPEYKLLTVRNIPQMSDTSLQYSTFQWPGLLKHMRQMMIANCAMEEGIDWQVKASPCSQSFNKSLANLLVLRGVDLDQADAKSFKDSYLYTKWMPSDNACKIWSHPKAFKGYGKSAALLSNSQSPVGSLDKIVDKAWRMFGSKAYVHQYFKHGLAEDDFMDCFATLEQVVSSYKHL